MEALEFLKEAKRKCSSTTCDVCHTERLGIMCPLFEWSDGKLEQLVSEVEQWSKDHPIITNAQKFKEVFGCEPKLYSGIFLCPVPKSPYCGEEPDCRTCGEWWWNEPYKEPEHD